MPFYRFQIEVPQRQQLVMDRIRSLVRERPSFWQSFSEAWKPRDPKLPPFIGSVDEDSFKLSRDIRYRNSFLPLIRGHVLATPTGTQINVAMFMHPLVAVFMTFWLGMAGAGTFAIYSAKEASSSIPAGMFLFGLALMCGGFFPEAFKAKRILADAFSVQDIRSSTR
jgi:hypothetical protein